MPPLTTKVESEDIPFEPEPEPAPEPEVLGRGQHERVQRIPFSPRMKERHHKALEFVRGSTTKCNETILTSGTEELNSLHMYGRSQVGWYYVVLRRTVKVRPIPVNVGQ